MTTAPMSAEELKRLAQLNKDRTQGEWLYFDHAHACVAVSDVHYKVLLTCSQKEIDAAEHDPRQCYGDDVVREGIRNVKFAVAAANAMPRLLDHIAALEAERDAAYARGLEDAAMLVETIIVSGPENDDVDHDDYRDTQIAAAIRALAQKGE